MTQEPLVLQAIKAAGSVEALVASLTDAEAKKFFITWEAWGRPKQFAPDHPQHSCPGCTNEYWKVWLFLAGRASGKTRAGAEAIREAVESGRATRIAFVAATAADARDVMVEGESGILAVSDPDFMPIYEPSKRRITWPNGAVATLYTAEEPSRLRGPQHDLAWCDEIAAWKYPETWDMMKMGLRLGKDPKVYVTTTPKATKLVKAIFNDPATHVTHGTTWENAGNLAASYLDDLKAKYAGTRLGRQELEAQILEDVPGALWTRDLIDKHRLSEPGLKLEYDRIVVAIDPAVTSEESSDETGIMVVGKIGDQGYVIEDVSKKGSPNIWAQAAIDAYHKYGASRIVAEANNGGDMIETVIRLLDPNVSYKKVHASQGKKTRAEPVSALYEKGRIHHLGSFGVLEDQMATWVPGEKSPDRMDALVWGFTELFNLTKGARWAAFQ